MDLFLFTNANYLLPYTGAGSGVLRALEYDPNVIFSNGLNQREITHSSNEFVITIPRKVDQVTNQAQSETDPVTDQPHSKTDQVNDQVAQNTTKLAHKADPASPKSEQPTDLVVQNTDPAISKSEQPHIKLTQKQKDIRNFCSVPRTAKEIMERLGLNGPHDGINDDINDGINQLSRTLQDVYNKIVNQPEIITKELMKALKFSESTVTRSIRELKKLGFIKRDGSRKKGKWIILK